MLSGSARAGPADFALNWLGGQSAPALRFSHAPRREFSFFPKSAKIADFRFFFEKKGLKSALEFMKKKEEVEFYKIFIKK